LKPENQNSRIHIPVLLSETLELLALSSGKNSIDMTLGLGGHSEQILLNTSPNGKLLGIDKDAGVLKLASQNLIEFGDRFVCAQGSFANSLEISKKYNISKVDAILFDLGISSWQLDTAARGFGFKEEGPLDMRMNPETGQTAADIVNFTNEKELADLLYLYGDERLSRQISKSICFKRKEKRIETTEQLAKIVAEAYYRRGWKRSKVNPATKTFQALRIAVNDEVNELKKGLMAGAELLSPGGRMAVISFHSGEDRIVKHFFRSLSREMKLGKILTKKPIVATLEEKKENPRARSAKLRGFEKASINN